MSNKIIKVEPIGFQWETEDPFLITMYHKDFYPEGNDELGPNVSLEGRNIGGDFTIKDGFRMYHGTTVPGFPAHPHRGFETVTIVLQGFVDHFDSKGASGRYGQGDVQWLTTGSGCQHTEMFPLLNKDKPNPLELFQIWLNLPKKNKLVEPEYRMLWAEDIPIIDNGKGTKVRLIAGNYLGHESLEPNSASWAKDKNNHVNIFVVEMEANAAFTLPKVSETLNRNVYFYDGSSLQVENEKIAVNSRVKLNGNAEINIVNGDEKGYLLVLEGEPINEPVVQYGPFVMTSEEEIRATFEEFQRTQFGGWQWGRRDPVHGPNEGRFAKYADGTMERR